MAQSKPKYKRELFEKWRMQERASDKVERKLGVQKEFRDGGEWLRKPRDIQ